MCRVQLRLDQAAETGAFAMRMRRLRAVSGLRPSTALIGLGAVDRG